MPSPQETAKNIKKQCQSRGITAKKLLEECELGVNTLGKMSKGNDVTTQTLIKIADYLNVSIDFLLGRTIKNNAPDEIRSAIISKVYSMPDEQCKKLLDFLESLFRE